MWSFSKITPNFSNFFTLFLWVSLEVICHWKTPTLKVGDGTHKSLWSASTTRFSKLHSHHIYVLILNCNLSLPTDLWCPLVEGCMTSTNLQGYCLLTESLLKSKETYLAWKHQFGISNHDFYEGLTIWNCITWLTRQILDTKLVAKRVLFFTIFCSEKKSNSKNHLPICDTKKWN